MAGFFSQESLERIRAANDIVEVIGAALPLKRAGGSFVALCPFHKEKTPSFHVNPQRQIFHCFGCHKGGDVFTFVKEYENIPFPDAVRRLAERARIPLEFDQSPVQRDARQVKDRLLQIHEQIAQRWQNVLANEAAGQAARDYLARRGVPAEAVKLFRLGAAPEDWDDTVNWSKGKGFTLADMEQAGLVLRKEGSDHYYDRFRGRLIFPICDEQGRVIAFSGRLLAVDAKAAKYVNSPETPIFTKSKVFYGLDKSKRALLEAGCAVICEGQLDLIACYLADVQNVVAPQGTAFTAEHARLLKRYVEEVVLCFDSDEAGQDAATRSLDHLLASGLAVRVAAVPAPHDPDSFIKTSGAEAFRALIEQAEEFFAYHLKRLCRQHDPQTDRGRIAILNEMATAVLKTSNAVLVDNYAQETALRLGVSPDAVRSEFRKRTRTQPTLQQEEGQSGAAPPPPASPPGHELWLLKLLCRHDEAAPWLSAHLDLAWITHETVRGVVAVWLRMHEEGNWLGIPAWLDAFDDPAAQGLISEAAATERPIPHPAQQLLDVVTRLRNQFLDREIAGCAQRAGLPETPDDQRLKLLQRLQCLRDQKKTALPRPVGLPD